jgi:fructose-1,6-bisphosphatase/inositol monophosphatase family enzyme
MLVAEGAAEVAVDAAGLALWDTAPMKVIVEEAGGRFDDPVSSNGLIDLSGLR